MHTDVYGFRSSRVELLKSTTHKNGIFVVFGDTKKTSDNQTLQLRHQVSMNKYLEFSIYEWKQPECKEAVSGS